MSDLLEEITAEIATLWGEASCATSGGEGLAAMHFVRVAQIKLVDALVAAADRAEDDEATAHAHLSRARATLLDVLTSAHGPEYPTYVPVLDAVLARLGVAPTDDRRAIALAWLGLAEHQVKYGWPEEGRELARRAEALATTLPDAAALLARARAV